MRSIANSKEDDKIWERLSSRIEEQASRAQKQVAQGEKPAVPPRAEVVQVEQPPVVRDQVEWTYEYTFETDDGDGTQPGGIPANLIHEVAGEFSSVHCEAPAYLELTLQGKERALRLVSWDYTMIEYIVPAP